MTRRRQPNPPASGIAATEIESPHAQQTRHGLPIAGTLRLRGEVTTTTTATTTEEEPPAEQRRIQWAEDVVDNEGQGKKSSKVCCIYHKPRAVGESSSESDSSDSDSDSSDGDDVDNDSEVDTGEARLSHGSGRSSARRSRRHHDHNNRDEDGAHPADCGKPQKRKPKLNAYERVPKYTKKGEDTR
ncbi:Type 1 phosphatases regulator ypi1 [Emydomyces testavorans]|uniref:Type 1 phosphatases regulator n=1 Tax=Emydomyces testavorans TaxID=2070801 RepID=A0AAF0DC84_9EURO|nr:Type 1 phosphatases regulator ypi1 [Emydomyces testavorans]